MVNINDQGKAIKKTRFEDEDNEYLLKGSGSPFTNEILKAQLPKRMKSNFTLRYDGTIDPRAYIRDLVFFMALDQVSSRVTYKYFAITLTGNAKVWFTKLAPWSISSWE